MLLVGGRSFSELRLNEYAKQVGRLRINDGWESKLMGTVGLWYLLSCRHSSFFLLCLNGFRGKHCKGLYLENVAIIKHYAFGITYPVLL